MSLFKSAAHGIAGRDLNVRTYNERIQADRDRLIESMMLMDEKLNRTSLEREARDHGNVRLRQILEALLLIAEMRR